MTVSRKTAVSASLWEEVRPDMCHLRSGLVYMTIARLWPWDCDAEGKWWMFPCNRRQRDEEHRMLAGSSMQSLGMSTGLRWRWEYVLPVDIFTKEREAEEHGCWARPSAQAGSAAQVWMWLVLLRIQEVQCAEWPPWAEKIGNHEMHP